MLLQRLHPPLPQKPSTPPRRRRSCRSILCWLIASVTGPLATSTIRSTLYRNFNFYFPATTFAGTLTFPVTIHRNPNLSRPHHFVGTILSSNEPYHRSTTTHFQSTVTEIRCSATAISSFHRCCSYRSPSPAIHLSSAADHRTLLLLLFL